jgi:hypothetical protein
MLMGIVQHDDTPHKHEKKISLCGGIKVSAGSTIAG